MAMFKRSAYAQRNYRTKMLLSTEGSVTEPEYFNQFNSATLKVDVLHGKGKSSPSQVLRRMRQGMEQHQLRQDTGDMLWLVIDRDNWTVDEIEELRKWVDEKSNIPRALALSNPKFEFWLLLHFDRNTTCVTARACVDKLKEFLPEYDKHLGCRFSVEQINSAIAEAERRWGGGDIRIWPRETGRTNVFALCKILLRYRGIATHKPTNP